MSPRITEEARDTATYAPGMRTTRLYSSLLPAASLRASEFCLGGLIQFLQFSESCWLRHAFTTVLSRLFVDLTKSPGVFTRILVASYLTLKPARRSVALDRNFVRRARKMLNTSIPPPLNPEALDSSSSGSVLHGSSWDVRS